MVEINNQRKAFLDMLAWSEGTGNGRQKTRNHGYDVIVGGELFTDYSDHPRKLVTLNPKLKSSRRRTLQLLSVGGMPQQLGLKDFSPKSQDAVALQQLRAWRFTYDWSWWYPSGNQPLQLNYLGFTAGRWLWSSSSIRLTAWLQNSKRAERSEIDVWAESPRLYRSGYLHHRLPVMGC